MPSMTPAEALAYMRSEHADALAAVVAEAPPLPAGAIELLRGLGLPCHRPGSSTVS